MAAISGGSIDISKYVEQLAELKELVQKAKNGEEDLDDVNAQLQKSFESVRKEVNELKNVYAALNKEMNNFDEKNEIKNSLKSLQSDLEKVSKSLEKLREDTVSTNQRLEELSFGGSNGSGSASTAWGDLETQLKNINLTSEELEQNFLDVKTAMDSSGNSTTTYNNGLDTTVKIYKRATEEGEEYKVTLEKINQENKNTASSAKYIDSSANALKRLGLNADEVLDITKAMNNDSTSSWTMARKSINANGDAVYELRNNLDKVVTVTQKNVDGTNQFSASLKQVTNNAKEATKEAGTWGYSWKRAWQSFLTYMSVTDIFFRVKNAIMDMVEEVEELDEALVELQKVTDLEGESLEKFIDNAYEAGETVAKTGTEMIEAATAFAKAGFKENALDLGTIASMYTNIADEEISAADAADMIIAQIKAFNIEAENSIHIIDAINEVSNNFAVSSADISRNLGKASAVMANAGNSLEQYIGLMTAGTEITRNASKVANGLKTITLRLQGMNDEGEKDLELVAQMEGLYKKLGVTVYNTDGSLKNTYELLEQLAKVYPDLTAAEKAYVTETIAGKFQSQNAAAILNNWATAVKATETAMNSAGSAAKENEKVLNSIQGHLQRLKSAWENLSRSVVNSNFLKFIIDLGTTLVNIANNNVVQFIVKLEALALIFKLLAASSIGKTIVALYSLAASEGVAATSTLALDAVMNLLNKTLIGRLILSFAAYIKSVYTVTAANGILTGSMFALKGALDVLAAHPIIFALTAFVGTMALLKSRTQAVRDEIEELSDELSELEEIDSRLGEIQDKFAEGNLSVSEQKELFEEIKELQKKLRDEYNINTKVLNTANGEIEKQIENMRTLIELEERKKNKKALEDTQDVGAGMSFGEFVLTPSRWLDGFTKEGAKRIEKEVNEYKEKIIEYAKGSNKEIAEAFSDFSETINDPNITRNKFGEYFTATFKAIQDSDLNEEAKGYLYVYLNDIKRDYEEALNETFNINQVKESIKLPQWKGVIDRLLTGLDYDLGDGIKFHISSALEDGLDSDWFREQIHRIAKENGFADMNLIDELGIDTELNEEGLWNHLNALIVMSNGLGIPLEELLDILVELYPQLASVSDATQLARTSFEELGEELIGIKDAYNDIKDALEEYNENGYFTVDTLNTLLTKYPDYLDALVDENGNIRDNTEMFQALAEAKLNDIQASEDARYYNELLKLAQLDEAGAAQLAAGSINAHDQAMAGQEVNAEKLRSQIEANIQAFNAESAAALQAAYDIAEANHIRNNTVIEKTRLGIRTNFSGSMGRSSSKSSSSSSAKKEKEWWEKAFDDLKDQFNYSEITINEYINGLENLLGKVGKGTEAWRKINKELQKQKLNKIKDDYDAGRISLNQYIISLQNLQQAYREGTDAWNDLADAIKKAKLNQLKEQQSDLKAALSAVNTELENQIKNYEDLKDAAIDAIDAEIEEQEELQDTINNNINDYEKAQKAVLKYLNEQLDNLNNNKTSVEEYYNAVTQALQDMNEEQEKATQLAEAYENLVNAMTQKNKKVWREGLGWVWEADQEAIKEAQKSYDDLVKQSQLDEIEKNKTQTLATLDEQINALTDYITSWNDVLDKFENEQNTNIANLLLGENWSEAVSQLDPNIVNDFSNAYYNLQKSLKETEDELERLNKQKKDEEEYWDTIIDKVKDYKDQWSDVANAYEEAANKQKANQLLMANWEKDILEQRINVLEDFKNKYNSILSEIDKVDKMSSNAASTYTPYSLPGYSNGGEVDFTGLAMLHGTPYKPEYVLNNDQMKNLLSNLIKPQYTSNINSGSSIINNYNFGDIELPNVNNAQQFINELKSLVNTTKNL